MRRIENELRRMSDETLPSRTDDRLVIGRKPIARNLGVTPSMFDALRKSGALDGIVFQYSPKCIAARESSLRRFAAPDPAK